MRRCVDLVTETVVGGWDIGIWSKCGMTSFRQGFAEDPLLDLPATSDSTGVRTDTDPVPSQDSSS